MTSFLYSERVQARLHVWRNRHSGIWRALFAAAGLYRPIPSEELALVHKDKIVVHGDAPWKSADQGDAPNPAASVHVQGRLVFRVERPPYERVANLVVTPNGAGWKDGVLHQRYCAGAPGLRTFLSRRSPQKTFPAGYFVQSMNQTTYGDWVSEYLCALARLEEINAPLFLPVDIAGKAYVRRDLAAIGVESVTIDRPMKISAAKVLRQRKFFMHFPREDIAPLRRLLGAAPPSSAAGSIVYLSRRGEQSEVANRVYPNDVIESAIKARRGRVIMTAKAELSDYLRAAADAETVVFDHGSAIYNAVYWRPKRAIEITSGAWWNNSFVTFMDALGVRDYTIIRGAGGDDRVSRMLEETLDRPIET